MFQFSVSGTVKAVALSAALILTPAILAPDILAPAMASEHEAHGHSGSMQPAELKIGDLTLTAPWSRATPGGAKVAAGYMQITNHGKTADWLTGGTFSRSARVEIHEMAMKDGIMTMRPLKDGLEIPPGKTVTLAPGGYHIMFMGLQNPLKEGENVAGTLDFKTAGKLDVTYQVRSIAAGHKHSRH
ncbi:copper chaperone PCu(A)C [Xanthobacter sp. TB0139]|uniref:copper chaperone PCu(A)C n=1 Tax=Xanthobacter sp. TB0139 TaxID=3459178 RepID=UPI00403901B7